MVVTIRACTEDNDSSCTGWEPAVDHTGTLLSWDWTTQAKKTAITQQHRWVQVHVAMHNDGDVDNGSFNAEVIEEHTIEPLHV